MNRRNKEVTIEDIAGRELLQKLQYLQNISSGKEKKQKDDSD